jgi:hypothetical protein
MSHLIRFRLPRVKNGDREVTILFAENVLVFSALNPARIKIVNLMGKLFIK